MSSNESKHSISLICDEQFAISTLHSQLCIHGIPENNLQTLL